MITSDEQPTPAKAAQMAKRTAAAVPWKDYVVAVGLATAALGAAFLGAELGLRPDQLAVTVLTLYDRLGEVMFRRSFGVPGNLDHVGKFVERAKAAGITQQTPPAEIVAFIGKMFAKGPPPAAPRTVVT